MNHELARIRRQQESLARLADVQAKFRANRGEVVRREPDPDCEYCEIAQRFGEVVWCMCLTSDNEAYRMQ